MKRILGLDLGTNSIGWATVLAEKSDKNNLQVSKIEAAGSRIIPMDATILGDFEKGNSVSQTATRTKLRGVRRMTERSLLRRERMHRVLDIIGFLPPHYSQALDRYGKFKKGEECKLAWRKNEYGKHEFIFLDSFNEMLKEFHESNPCIKGKKIPIDWTIYYLRKKALTQKISKEELAWILLNFNQKRGYYQLRSEDEDDNKWKRIEYKSLTVVAVEETEDRKGDECWYNVLLENGWIFRRKSKIQLDWVGKTKDFIITTDIDENGNIKIDKDGNEKRSFRAPNENDWTLIKERTQAQIKESEKTVGEYIYNYLLNYPGQKIRGKLVRTIEREFYKEELNKILTKQVEFHPELRDRSLYQLCIDELYPSNGAYRNSIANKDFIYLFKDDILFYHRPLKTKKSLIENCPYEEHIVIDKLTGEEKHYGIKCIAKSHPLYQEFRLWQFINNLRIYKKRVSDDIDVTAEFFKTSDDYVALFDWLNDINGIKQNELLKYIGLENKNSHYRWNYVEDKEYPCNETRALLLSYYSKANIDTDLLTREIEEKLWHLLYSIDDKNELSSALKKFAEKHELGAEFIDTFRKFPPFEKEYGAYSLKATEKLLQLMRLGKYWSESKIDPKTRNRIEKILTGEYDENIKERVRNKTTTFTDINSFQFLPLWLACYIIYNRHSEAKQIIRWNTPADLRQFLNSFKQHSLRNPIVEQVVTETLRVVKDIWEQYGNIDEIHIELGREMKNPKEKRIKIAKQISDNENTNLRIKNLLKEFMCEEYGIEGVRPYSPNQQDILRIYEEGVFSSVGNIPEEIKGTLKNLSNRNPSKSDVMRYRLWLEQKYRSPYTGEPIPLAKLFTSAYEIEHIIPKSRYFDDSLSNKVICESAVNTLKSNFLGYEFIQEHHGQVVDLSMGKRVKIFTVAEYEQFVKDHYSNNRKKLRKLMMDTIPDDFIERQLNDNRYISKVVTGLISNIVREDGEEDTTSKNVIVCTGSITSKLKQDWGLNDVWNKIILPRFLRLNKIKESQNFTAHSANGHIIPSMPLELQKGFNKKRIDHRHHAMDAIVIACANRNIVNYLNNVSASANAKISRQDLRKILCEKTTTTDSWVIKKPWATFTQDTHEVLNNIIVSIKQNLRVVNKATNIYEHYENGKKVKAKQNGLNWAIRKSMHKDTVFGEVNLRMIKTVSLDIAIKNPSRIVEKDFKHKLTTLVAMGYDKKRIKQYFDENKDVWQDINLQKIKVYYFTKETNDRFFATRKSLDTSFDHKKIEGSITDTGIQQILLRHLEQNGNNSEIAFSPDGIDEMNRNIVSLNNGKYHQPIYKVRVYENANKFTVGETGNKSAKFVEADKGTNLFFAVYENKSVNEYTGETETTRKFATIPLNDAISRLKQGLSPAPNDENGNAPIFVLSPNDIVYVPTADELATKKISMPLNPERLYKMVSANKTACFFIQSNVANIILDKVEYSAANKMERAITGEMIKAICIPIKVNRLGNIQLIKLN